MRTLILAFITLCLCTTASLAQHEADNWYFGAYAGIRFEQGGPVALLDGQMNTVEGCAVISDRYSGKLLFYTNGNIAWNAEHVPMRNGIGLRGGESSTQSAAIVPNPADSMQYYLFTVGTSSAVKPDTNGPGLWYSLVDMREGFGLGSIVRKNIKLLDSTGEKISVTRQCNGQAYWILTHHLRKDEFYAYRLDANGLDTVPVVSTYPELDGNPIRKFTYGSMKFAPNGKKIAMAAGGTGLAFFSFDNESGTVKRIAKLNSNHWFYYGVSFSPDNTKVYATAGATVIQYDISAGDSSAIVGTETTIARAETEHGVSLQLGPDGKIYVAQDDTLGVIAEPNKAGTACNYQGRAVWLGGRECRYGLPNFPDYLFADDPDAGLDCAIPISKFSGDTALCAGRTIVFADASRRNPAQWRWRFPGGQPDRYDGKEPPPILYETPGIYTVELITENPNGSDTATRRVTVHPVPAVSAGPDVTICAGQSAKLSADGADAYQWQPQDGLSDPQSPTPTASPNSTTEYIVTGTNQFGCESRDTVLVTVVDKVIASVTPDTSMCDGESIVLQAGGGSTYRWQPQEGLSDPDSPIPTASPNSTTLYTVFVSSGSCRDSAVVLVTVLPAARAEAGPDTAICPGQSTVLQGSGTGRFQWQPQEGLSDPNSPTPTATPTQTTRYTVTVTNDAGCTATDSVLVTIGGTLAVDAGADTAICRGDSVLLSAGGAAAYRWEPAALVRDANAAVTWAYPTANTHFVLYGLDADCEGTDSVFVAVLDVPAVLAGPDVTICAGQSASLNASGADTYQWQPAHGLSDPDSPNPTATPTQTTRYTVTGTNAAGCAATQTVLVTVLDESVLRFTVETQSAEALPGDERLLLVSLDADHETLDRIAADEIRLRLRTDPATLGLYDVPETALNGWNWLATESGGEIHISGSGPMLTAAGPLLRLPLRVFLSDLDTLFAAVELLSAEIETRDNCFNIATADGGIPLHELCLRNLRTISLHGTRYGLRVVDNPGKAPVLHYSLGIAAECRIRVYNCLGAEVLNLDGFREAGEYHAELGGLPAGVYYCRLDSGPFRATARTVITP